MRMKSKQSYLNLSSNESLSPEKSSEEEYTADCIREYELRSDDERNEEQEHSEKTDGSITELFFNDVPIINDDQSSYINNRKPSKRKASLCETVSSSEKQVKISRKNSTSDPLLATPEITTPVTPPPSNNYLDDFLRRVPPKPSTPDRKDLFTELPDEVILMIFKNCSKSTLISCACVCRRWKNIAFDNDLWPRIDLSQRKILPGIMMHVLSRKPIVLRMAQAEVNTPIFKVVDDSLGDFKSKIEYLDLSMAVILSHDLEMLLRTCSSLLKLSLENCEMNESICREISKNTKLTVLNLSQCTGLNDVGLRFLLKNCRKLVELNIAWTSLDAAAMKTVCQFLPEEIRKLNFSGCVKEMTDAHVNALVIRCNKLTELDLSDATGITAISIKAICENLKNVQVLSLSRCYNIYPTNYSKLFALPYLTHLNIFGLFSETQIEHLRNSFSVNVNQMKFSYIARPTVGDRRTSIWCMPVRD